MKKIITWALVALMALPASAGPIREAFEIGSDFLLGLGWGQVLGYRRITALGNNPSIDTATTPEDVWSGGGVYPWMTAATSLEAVSGCAADAAAGTGARTVIISGLDAAYVEIASTVTLNGVTAVAVPVQFFRINSAAVVTSGSGQTNACDVSIRDAGAGTVRAVLPAGYGITRQSQYTVPAGHSLQVISQLFSFAQVSAGARFATFAVWTRTPGGTFRMPLEFAIGDEPPYRHDGIPGIFIPEKTDFQIRVTGVSNNGTALTAGWLGVLKRNELN